MPQFLNILLQKSDPKLSWGFDIVGGREYGLPLTICQVSSNSFSSQYLSRGDEIVQIEGIDASLFTEAEALSFIKKPSKSLDLVILKRSPDETLNRNDAKTSRFRKQTQENPKKSLQTASPEIISRRSRVVSEKKKSYKRSSSVPSEYSSCGPPTYQLHYTVPDVDTNRTQRVSWIRDRSESPPFWRSNQNNASRSVDKNVKCSRVFWRQMENSGTDGECDSEVAEYCKSRSRRDQWVSRSNSIDSSVSREDISMSTVQSRTASNKEASYRVPVQFDFDQSRRCRDGGVSEIVCDKEISRSSSTRRDRWKQRSSSIDSTLSIENTSVRTQTAYKEDTQEYRYRIPVHFDYYEHREKEQKQRRVNFSDQQQSRQRDQTNVSKVYLSPYDLKMHKNIIQSLQPLRMGKRRQTSQIDEKSPQAQASCESTPAAVANNSNAAAPSAPPTPAPPPPPPPAMNGTIPTIRLKSEISDRCDPPAKILNAMSKDKKPFTYTPGGIDLSEIKSPRMARRIMTNAQTPDDIILPTPPPTVNPGTLPPSAVAAMTPQIAIPVFPQNGLPKKTAHHSPSPQTQSPQKQPVSASPPPPPMQKQTMTPPPPPQRRSVSPTPLQQPAKTVAVTSQQNQTPQQQPPRMIVVNSQPAPQPQQQHNQQPTRTIVITTNSQSDKPKEQPRAQVGSIYVPPVVNEQTQNSKPSFPVLREAPTPWLQKNQQAHENNTPAWVNRNRNNAENEQNEVVYERKPRVQQVQTEKEFSEPDKPVAGTRVIPIQIEGATQTHNQSNSRPSSQRWGAPINNQTVPSNQNNINVNRGNGANSNKSFNEPDTKPIQSRSFKVIQRITGSEDDNVDYSSDVPYNSENVPISQLRRLHLCDDDQTFMNKVKSQANGVSIIEIKNDDFDVDEDIFLHSETDPRYRGSAIPSKAFRKLQNMTDSGQVIPVTIEVQSQERNRPSPTLTKDTNEEPQKKYIPPSERQAEQDLRKYMGSSIPSRSFRMLQAMTSTQQSSQNTKRIDNIDEDARFLYPNPYPDPPKSLDEIGPFWMHYVYLFNLVSEKLPHKLFPSLNLFENGHLPLESDSEQYYVADFHRDEYSENENTANGHNLSEDPMKDELIIDEVVKDDSDHEVSLTICIPLRRKSKSIEYHEEVTLKGSGDLIKNDSVSSSQSSSLKSDVEKCSEPADNSPTLDTNDAKDVKPNSSDTEHSESSSVDFWKEIATDEEIYFKPRSITPGAESRPRSSAFEDTTTDDDGYFKPTTPSDTLPESHICDEVTIDEDGLFQTKASTQNLDNEQRSQSCDDELFESNHLESVIFDETSLEDRRFNLRPKTPAFERRSESPAWYEDLTDEDGYSRTRSRTPAFDGHSGSPYICDELTPSQNQPRSADADHSEAPRASWDLGQDIENYCKYTPMDSETNSTSSGSTEDLDEPFNNSSNSSSSDENDSYNVYEFSTNISVQPADLNETLIADDPPVAQDDAKVDDDDDSGMSDAGKHLPEPEQLGSELRKLSKYQRANTHSRLLRILQEEEDKRCGKSELTVRKESLTLPLGANSWLTESVSSSSGINSPLSPVVNEKLVNELVQSLLNGKGLSYHKLPAEKLREAAIKSLYESCSDTSRACSPYNNCSADKSKHASQDGDTTSQTDCYDSHDENSVYYPGFDIFPSRAFKNLQSGRSTPMNWPKCPLLSTQSAHPPVPNTKLNSTPDKTHDR